MSAALIDKLRAARESWVTAGAFEFRVRRPTDVALYKAREEDNSDFLRRVLVDWKGVRECDVLPSGGAQALAFEAEVAVEWLEDRPDLYAQIVAGVEALIRAHFQARADAEKK